MRDLFASVRGVTCNTKAEWIWSTKAYTGLVESLFIPIGNGVEKSSPALEPSQSLPKMIEGRPFIIFIGRMIPEKGLDFLLNAYQAFQKKVQDAPLLVLVGDGPMATDPRIARNKSIVSLGWVDGELKNQLLRHALALVHLSQLESFSLVMMEAWLEELPVVVDSRCLATYSHVLACEGGYGIASENEFVAKLSLIVESPAGFRKEMGRRGAEYVENNFSWDRVCSNYTAALVKIFSWKEERLPLAKMIGLKSEKISQQNFLMRGSLKPDFYARFEDRYRGVDSIETTKESWNYYFEHHFSKFKQDAVIVDLGAGSGDLLGFLKRRLPSNLYFGVEPDQASYKRLLGKGFAACALTANEFADRVEPETVDVLILMHVIEHIPWPDWALLLAKLKLVLKPGGILIIELPNAWSTFTNALFFWQDPTHIRPLNPVAIDQVLCEAGFKVWEKPEFAPHLSEKDRQFLSDRLGSADLVKSLYGKQDFAFVCQKVD